MTRLRKTKNKTCPTMQHMRYKTTLLTHCRNYMVCSQTYYIIKHCTNKTCFSLFQITIYSHKQLPPKHSSVLSQPHHPCIPISSHCMLCLSARLLIVCPNGCSCPHSCHRSRTIYSSLINTRQTYLTVNAQSTMTVMSGQILQHTKK